MLVVAIGLAVALIAHALHTPRTYTSNAIIFPLTAGSDNKTGGVLSALTGGSDIGKSFTDENSVNIVELAQSRTTREEVAATRIPDKGNRTIAELLLTDYNQNRGVFEKEIHIKPDDPALINWASRQFVASLNASITKTSSFQLRYSGRSPEMVRIVSYAFIDKISQFYIELKREKARLDFEFASVKVDSLRGVMNAKDQRLIAMDRRTLFTNTSKLEYKVPAENVLADKQMVRAQYANAVANQQNAAYKLQKATPVIKLLDKPEGPYETSGKSPVTYGLGGFFAGFLLMALFFASPVLIRYASFELSKMIYGPQTKS